VTANSLPTQAKQAQIQDQGKAAFRCSADNWLLHDLFIHKSSSQAICAIQARMRSNTSLGSPESAGRFLALHDAAKIGGALSLGGVGSFEGFGHDGASSDSLDGFSRSLRRKYRPTTRVPHPTPTAKGRAPNM
jgi:hypothetical protein